MSINPTMVTKMKTGSLLYHFRNAAVAILLLGSGFPAVAQVGEQEFQELLWIDLLPFEDLQALLNPPPVLHFSPEEDNAQTLRRMNQEIFDEPENNPFEQALVSTRVKSELNGSMVRLPGFVVPLEYDEKQRVTEFFLVPYFGACIHVPPPPPNQIVYVSYPAGLELPSIYEPFNIEGRLLTEVTDNAVALSAYRIEASAVSIYPEEDIE